MMCAGKQVIEIIAHHGHMTEFASRADLLAVKVHLEARVAGKHMPICLHERRKVARILRSHDVDHHRPGGDGAGVSQGEVKHGAQVVLELTRHRPVNGPVPGIMRPHGELVDEDSRRRIEELDRQHAGDVERTGNLQGDPLSLESAIIREVRAWRHNLGAHAIDLHRAHDRIGDRLTVRAPRDLGGQLSGEGHAFFCKPSRVCDERCLCHHALRRCDVVDDPHPASVVPSTGDLEHERPTQRIAHGFEIIRGRDVAPRW